jgi:hypothetical protein
MSERDSDMIRALLERPLVSADQRRDWEAMRARIDIEVQERLNEVNQLLGRKKELSNF